MAFKDPVFYNVDHGVGRGKPNRRADVMLVQFLLREVLNHPDLRPARPPGRDMVVDGIFGPQTEGWTRSYQSFLRLNGKAIAVDGKVNAAPSDYASRSPSNAPYTIAHLNATFRRRWRSEHDYLEKCPRLHPELRGELVEGI